MKKSYEALMEQIQTTGARFESLVQMPERRDPDWNYRWFARATLEGRGVNGTGDTDIGALEDLLNSLLEKRQAA